MSHKIAFILTMAIKGSVDTSSKRLPIQMGRTDFIVRINFILVYSTFNFLCTNINALNKFSECKMRKRYTNKTNPQNNKATQNKSREFHHVRAHFYTVTFALFGYVIFEITALLYEMLKLCKVIEFGLVRKQPQWSFNYELTQRD